MFKTYHNSFTTDEAAENLSALKFSQSNRAPDPREPSRVVTTTTTTTFSMNRDMAKGICQHFMDARLIENAADPASGVFKDKGIYQLTPKGLHILERFITKNGINGEHLLKVFSSQPICMKLLHLERRAHDDELLINRPIIEVVFRRFCGRQPNYLPGEHSHPSSDFDRTLGIGVIDITEKPRGYKAPVTVKHTFSAIAALDWLCDFTTICGRDEAAEIAAHFQRLGLIEVAKDSTRKDSDDDSTVIVHGEDGIGRVSEGEFKCHYKTVYGLTDRGRAIARWPGYAMPAQPYGGEKGAAASQDPSQHQLSSADPANASRGAVPPGYPMNRAASPDEIESLQDRVPSGGEAQPRASMSGHGTPSSVRSSQDIPRGIPGRPGGGDSSQNSRSASLESVNSVNVLGRKPSAAERLRNEYLTRSGHNSPQMNPAMMMDLATPAYHSRDSNTNRLRQILEEPALRSLFRDFLKQNFCEENLSFWLDTQDFKRRFHTTSSAVAVRPGGAVGSGSGDKSSRRGFFSRSDKTKDGKDGAANTDGSGQHLTAMERHQQDLIAMAFVIYNTYLAPASPCELNIEHNLRTDLVGYMNKVLNDAKTSSGGDGVRVVRAQDLQRGGSQPGTTIDSPVGGLEHGLTPAFAGPDAKGMPLEANASVEERKSTVSASMPRAPLHASQLQTIVRLYERIQDHTFRLMASDSVPRFIKDSRFLGLVKSVEEYTEALENGRLDPDDVVQGPAISKHVVDAMELGVASSSVGGGGISTTGTGSGSSSSGFPVGMAN